MQLILVLLSLFCTSSLAFLAIPAAIPTISHANFEYNGITMLYGFPYTISGVVQYLQDGDTSVRKKRIGYPAHTDQG
jgi:hypothetical protein